MQDKDCRLQTLNGPQEADLRQKERVTDWIKKTKYETIHIINASKSSALP